MYLSKLTLNPRSKRVQKELAYPYEMHRTVMRAFPQDLSEDERVLFRVDEEPRSRNPIVLVQSQGEPDWTFLQQDASDYLSESNEENPAVKPYSLRLFAGQVLAFRLRANPTVKRNGKRLGLYLENEQMAWLERKAASCGFNLLSARQTKDGMIGGQIFREGEKYPLKLLAVQFDGFLQVIDIHKLAVGIESGIGSGKGFGCGLLSIAPAR